MRKELIGYLGEFDSSLNLPFFVIGAGNLVGWLECKLKQWVYGFRGLYTLILYCSGLSRSLK